MVLQRLRTFHAGLPGRDAQIDHLERGKQRHALRAVAQFGPLEALLGDQHFAFAVTRSARDSADRVGSFDGEQQCLAVDDVQRPESFGKVLRQVFAGDLHSIILMV